MASSYGRVATPTRVPYGYDLKSFPSDPVVDPIVDAVYVKPPDFRRAGFLDLRADVRLDKKKVKSGLEILANGSRGGRSIAGPPLDNALDLGGSAPRYVQLKRHF